MIPEQPRQLISDVRAAAGALMAFNVNNMETAQGIVTAAEEARCAVMLQISPGAIAYAGYDAITAIARAEATRASVPVLVHLDHCRDPELVRTAIADGFSSVMFDGSRRPYAQNVAQYVVSADGKKLLYRTPGAQGALFLVDAAASAVIAPEATASSSSC